jgi:hypothetical protein
VNAMESVERNLLGSIGAGRLGRGERREPLGRLVQIKPVRTFAR